MMRWILALALAGAPWGVPAQSEAEVRTQAQASMLVTGSLDVEPDGAVSAVELDRKDALPPYVIDTVDRTVRAWLFEPEIRNGAAIPFRVRISVRVVAVPRGGGDFEISVSSASLIEQIPKTHTMTSERLRPPPYPTEALYRDASAVVYVLLKVGADGRVADSAVEQVNLRGAADGKTMAMLRKTFSESVLRASRRWTFQPPSEGPHVAKPFWTVRVPVSFFMHGTPDMNQYGQWTAYVPGPLQQAPWLEGVAADANDALGDGEVQLVDAGPRLRTPLQPAG